MPICKKTDPVSRTGNPPCMAAESIPNEGMGSDCIFLYNGFDDNRSGFLPLLKLS
jgi:hypothetical protein